MTPHIEKSTDFDISKQIRFVPAFQETETHFEKIAKSILAKRSMDSSVAKCVGREVYSALTVEQCSDYSVICQAILRTYGLVPEACRQKFRSLTKHDSQTYLEFARRKEVLFDRWCTAKVVGKNFNKLKQLMLVEEFKKCLHSDVKMYLDKQNADS